MVTVVGVSTDRGGKILGYKCAYADGKVRVITPQLLLEKIAKNEVSNATASINISGGKDMVGTEQHRALWDGYNKFKGFLQTLWGMKRRIECDINSANSLRRNDGVRRKALRKSKEGYYFTKNILDIYFGENYLCYVLPTGKLRVSTDGTVCFGGTSVVEYSKVPSLQWFETHILNGGVTKKYFLDDDFQTVFLSRIYLFEDLLKFYGVSSHGCGGK